MIEFLWPLMFGLLPLPVLVRFWLSPLANQGAALKVPSIALFLGSSTESHGFAMRQRPGLLLLLALIWCCAVLAAARPQWIGEPIELPVSGRDLLVAVDISGSMKAEDLTLGNRRATRLQVVKSVLGDFIERRAGDRIGLILFGTNAYLQVPLTFDRATVQRLLFETPIGIAGGKTAIGDAIGLAVRRLRERPADQRVLILLTDGANNVGAIEPVRAAELAASEGIRVHTIGVGADEMQVRSRLGPARLVNPAADLDEETLQAIAEATGGAYFRARDTDGLESTYAALDALEPVEQEAEIFRPTQSLFHWPLATALLLSLLAALIHTGVRRP